jgi:two-component system cell cycle sensor histidine kinase/response regulator CckA
VAPEPQASPAAPAEATARGELVLVTEDDPMLRDLLHAVLEDAGYRTRIAACGTEALEIATREGDDISLLLTDVIMPDIGGFELVRRLHQTLPGLRVIFTSGYSADVLSRRQGAEIRHPVLEKPYRIEDLLSEIRRTLDRPWPPAAA